MLTCVLNLADNLLERLKQIGASNDQQLATWAMVQQQVNSATQTMNNTWGAPWAPSMSVSRHYRRAASG